MQMKYSIIILLSLVLIVGISSPAYAQTITDHIVINEVDINPPGDDSESISEWVELYNPTDGDVDLSGWSIASTTILKKTLTIPEGTIISSGDFLTFVNQKVWFTDTAELIELRNSDGLLVDKTREVFDLENNFNSWQRTYDGFSDWKFVSSTAGSSNGKLIESYDSSPVTVTLSSDKSIYNFDDTAVIQGTVSERVFVEKPSFQSEPILINISGPNYEQAVSLYPDSNLNYETTLKLVQVLGISKGNYDVSVNYAGVTENTSFSIESKIIQTDVDVDSIFSIQTDQNQYLLDQSIFITGLTSEIIPFESMKFVVIDPTGKQITTGNLFTTDGKFDTSILINFAIPVYGDYIVTAEYSEHSTSTMFTLTKNIVVDPEILVSDSIFLNIDKSEYLLNHDMTLSGSITNFDSDSDIYYQVVDFNFSTSNGVPVTFQGRFDENDNLELHDEDFTVTSIPDELGTFSATLRIPLNIFSEGDYIVNAKYGDLVANQSFSIVSKIDSNIQTDSTGNVNSPSSEKLSDVFNVRTIIEKVNHISDTLVSINTEEKMIENQSVKPRVLSGSMITMSKDNLSDVNLRVVSESGICIIGTSDECLVSESTRKPGQIFEVVKIDGLNLNVRYSGPDVRLEKFSILPVSSDEFLPNTNWDVEVIKTDEISRLYYKITYKTLE